jgi:hypothetical protein
MVRVVPMGLKVQMERTAPKEPRAQTGPMARAARKAPKDQKGKTELTGPKEQTEPMGRKALREQPSAEWLQRAQPEQAAPLKPRLVGAQDCWAKDKPHIPGWKDRPGFPTCPNGP